MVDIMIGAEVGMLRRALVSIMELEPDFRVVAEVSSSSDIVSTARTCRPDVAVISIDLANLDGVSVAEALAAVLPDCRCLVFDWWESRDHAWCALASGAWGFILKDSGPEELIHAIRTISGGSRATDAALRLSGKTSSPRVLTGRECEILRLAAQGLGAAEIADRLYLASGTVRNYLTTIVRKLGARNRVDAIRIGKENGWL